MTDEIEALTKAISEIIEYQNAALYLRQGRRFRSLSADVLRERYGFFHKLVVLYGYMEHAASLHDLGVELSLREIPKPARLVARNWQAIRNRLKKIALKQSGHAILQVATLVLLLRQELILPT